MTINYPKNPPVPVRRQENLQKPVKDDDQVHYNKDHHCVLANGQRSCILPGQQINAIPANFLDHPNPSLAWDRTKAWRIQQHMDQILGRPCQQRNLLALNPIYAHGYNDQQRLVFYEPFPETKLDTMFEEYTVHDHVQLGLYRLEFAYYRL